LKNQNGKSELGKCVKWKNENPGAGTMERWGGKRRKGKMGK
jgi:hypothetical protein